MKGVKGVYTEALVYSLIHLKSGHKLLAFPREEK